MEKKLEYQLIAINGIHLWEMAVYKLENNLWCTQAKIMNKILIILFLLEDGRSQQWNGMKSNTAIAIFILLKSTVLDNNKYLISLKPK
jgi:hypothetical protein